MGPAGDELGVDVVVRDRDPEPLGVLVEQPALVEALGREPAQAHGAEARGVGVGRGEQAVGRPELGGGDAAPADLDGVGDAGALRGRAATARLETDDEDQGDREHHRGAEDVAEPFHGGLASTGPTACLYGAPERG